MPLPRRAEADLLRADHFTHLRCEVCTPDVVDGTEAFMASRDVHLISLMDHTPGQRQFRDIDKLLDWYRGKGRGEEALQELMAEKLAPVTSLRRAASRARLTAIAREHAVPLGEP